MRLARDRFTWLAYGQLSAFGYFFYGFGPVVPLLLQEQHTSRGVAAKSRRVPSTVVLTRTRAMP